MTVTVGNKNRIIAMLGKGLTPSVVATAVGVSESYISQLLSDPEFSAEVAQLRMESLEAHTSRDTAYDSIEDQLLEKMKDCVTYMVKPAEILAAIKIINGAQRRGLDPTQQAGVTGNTTIINLNLPKQIVSSFATNAVGQVVEAEHLTPTGVTEKQALITIQSDKIKSLLPTK